MFGAAIVVAGPWAASASLAALVVVSLIRGWLVPGRTVEREQAILERRVIDWKEAHRLSEQAREVQARQLDEIMDGVRTANAALADRPKGTS
jgi:hypothetical protein